MRIDIHLYCQSVQVLVISAFLFAFILFIVAKVRIVWTQIAIAFAPLAQFSDNCALISDCAELISRHLILNFSRCPFLESLYDRRCLT